MGLQKLQNLIFHLVLVDMKKVFEYVVYNQTEILCTGRVLAVDEGQARLLIPSNLEAGSVDFSVADVQVVIRPFC